MKIKISINIIIDLIKPNNTPPILSILLQTEWSSVVFEMFKIAITIEKNVSENKKVIIYENNIAKGQLPKRNSSRKGKFKINGSIVGPN